MVDASNPTGDSDAPPVTICCAAADEAAVCEAAQALVARGHVVELAVGVDANPEVLTRAIAAQRGQGLYVLCRSGSLDRGSVDGLRDVLRSHDVPFGRTLTLAVDAQRARELEERIVSVLRRMVTGRADTRARTWGSKAPAQEEDNTAIRPPPVTGSAPRPTPSPVTLQGLGTEPENADPYASTSQIEMAQSEGVVPPEYTGADHTSVAIESPALESSTLSGAERQSFGGNAPPTIPGNATPEPGVGGAPAGAFPPVPTGAPSASASASDSVSTDESSVPSSAPVVAPAIPGAPDPMAAFGSAPNGGGAEESAADFEPPLTMGGRMGRVLGSPTGLAVVLGGLAVVVLAVVLANVLGGDESDDAQASNDEAAAKSADAKTPEADAAKDDSAAADSPKADSSQTPEAETPEAESPEGETPEAAAADPGEAPAPAAATGADEDPPEVVEALRNREVRAIDVFLVAPEKKGTQTIEQSVDYCNELEVAGLTQWRVPTIGELNTVATARMLGKAVYWSSTLGDAFGDLYLVLNTKKDRISVVSKGYDGGKVVCIRPRRP